MSARTIISANRFWPIKSGPLSPRAHYVRPIMSAVPICPTHYVRRPILSAGPLCPIVPLWRKPSLEVRPIMYAGPLCPSHYVRLSFSGVSLAFSQGACSNSRKKYGLLLLACVVFVHALCSGRQKSAHTERALSIQVHCTVRSIIESWVLL